MAVFYSLSLPDVIVTLYFYISIQTFISPSRLYLLSILNQLLTKDCGELYRPTFSPSYIINNGTTLEGHALYHFQHGGNLPSALPDLASQSQPGIGVSRAHASGDVTGEAWLQAACGEVFIRGREPVPGGAEKVKRAMETCPFCGKAFKRLKTHLPHCKATEQAKKSPKTGTKKALLVEAKEQNSKKKILQNPKEASSLTPADPLHAAVIPPKTSALQDLPETSEILKASEDNWTWPNREAHFRSDIGKSRSAGVKSTVYEEVSKKALLEEAKEQNLKKNTLQNPKKASSLAPADPLHVAFTPPQALPRGSKFLKASEDNWTWPNPEADFGGAKGKSRRTGVKSTVYEEVSKKALLEEANKQYLKNKVLQNPKEASSLAPTDPLHVAVTPPQTSALQALPGGSEFLKASEDNWTWPNPEADFRGDIGKLRSAGVKSIVFEEVSKKALLVEAKEQYQNNEGDDTMEITKKSQLNKKKDGCQESCRTQQLTHEENEREHVKKDNKNNHSGHTHGNEHLIDKEENRSEYCPIEGPTILTTLQGLQVDSSLEPTDPLHGAVTPFQTSALQVLPGGSEFLKASENNFTWPNREADFRGAIEKTANIGIKSPLYEEVSKKASLVNAKEKCVKNEEDSTMTLPTHKGNFTGSIEKTGSLGINLPLYKEVSKVMEDRTRGEDQCTFQNGFKGSLKESLFQKNELPPVPNSFFPPSTMIFSSHGPHSEFPRHGDHVQLPHISLQLQTESDALKSTEKSLEGQLDLTPANETKTPWPVRDALSRNCSLGLQWIPELHSNYIQLKIVPKQIDLKSSRGRMGKSIAPGPFNPESFRPTQPQPIPEVPLTSRRLMNVRIGELPSWLALQRLSMNTIPELGVKAWTRYYNKYINVKKGGIGGLAMLLTGYCVLSYAWNYRHIRQDRWRKYH